MSDNEYRAILDAIGAVIEFDGTLGFSHLYEALPKLVRQYGTDCNLAGQSLARRHIAESEASLPEPDRLNPYHLRWAAEVTDQFVWTENSGGYTAITVVSEMRSEADRLDAARSAEGEREQRIEAAKGLYEREGWSGCDGLSWDRLSPATRDGWIYAAGLLRGGGRGE